MDNFTKIPNDILDILAKDMTEAELRIVLAICRKTIGWHKNGDKISLSQFEELTGMSRPGVIMGIKSAIKRGFIARERKSNSYSYSLLVNEVYQNSKRGLLDQSTRFTSNSKRGLPTKEKKETTIKESIKESNSVDVVFPSKNKNIHAVDLDERGWPLDWYNYTYDDEELRLV